MKKYIKPELETSIVSPLGNIANVTLGDWLFANELKADQNITTFLYES